ncbi:hypothetical protein P3T40_004616 [Paraburkholderia sp. EB58]|uniref:hypothetical protein n=1 Tax=Paraburkholderia sp. EB58 TaxID=3035125 RepID=UPI003D197975
MTVEKPFAPTDLRDFFKSQGWSLLEEAIKDRLYVFRHASYPRRQLIFPIDLTAPDYSESANSAVEKFADLTGQAKRSVVARLQWLKDDVLRLRIHFDGNDDVLPLAFASSLVYNTEKLLRSAACTVLRPRTHHPRLTLTEAAQFVDSARFAQTEQGSYVLRIACPINSMEVQGTLELGEADAPFVRQVTWSLREALTRLSGAIEGDTLDALVAEQKSSSSPLLSSNLCEALVGMHDDQVDNSLDVGFDWSVLRHTPLDLGPTVLRFQRDYFSRIEEVRRELRSVELDEEETFIGTVERLEGEMGIDGRRSGVVVLSLLLADEGETVRARTVLAPDEYALADQAHMTNGAYVRVAGRLRPGRQPRQLTNMTSFELLDTSRTPISA